MKQGRLLAFEGLDGCGKSTQVAALARALRNAGHEVLDTREPTDGPAGRRIRALARSGEIVAPELELRWFVEDRRAHVAAVIHPALESGRLVLTDRYYLSTVAYQGARGLDPVQILRDSEAEFPLPDLALLFEIEPEVALERVGGRGQPLDAAFEQREFLERVAANYRALDRPYLARIDARRPEDAVHAAVVGCVRERLGLL
ncbi:MAG: dTMP kinase [Myxococcales bacterium]|nr:dTMP kinase [Myxococcales bacterium]